MSEHAHDDTAGFLSASQCFLFGQGQRYAGYLELFTEGARRDLAQLARSTPFETRQVAQHCAARTVCFCDFGLDPNSQWGALTFLALQGRTHAFNANFHGTKRTLTSPFRIIELEYGRAQTPDEQRHTL